MNYNAPYFTYGGISIKDAFCRRVIDGDTAEFVFVPPGFPESAQYAFDCRFMGIDAPELDDPGGLEAKNYLANIIENKFVRLRLYKYDDFGRLLVRVYSGTPSVNNLMLNSGHAIVYNHK